MRLAELASLQRKLADRHHNAATSFDSITFKNLRGLSDISLTIEGGFLSICGGTGTGKTALIEAIYFALAGEDDPLPPSIGRLLGTQYDLSVSASGVVFRTEGTISNGNLLKDGYQHGVRLITLHDRTSFLQQSFSNNDVEVLKEGVGSTVLDDTSVATLSLVCRKSYSSIAYYEVEVETGIYVPFFEVVENGLSYDSRGMSTGELSAFFLAWASLIAETYSVLLIEEPEAYLPPNGHRSIIGMLAKYALAKRLAIAVTTHSTSIASEVPQSGIISLRRDGAISVVLPAGDDRQKALRRLGLSPLSRSIVLVEDNLARSILAEIISSSGVDDYSQVEIVVEKDGASAIFSILERTTEGIRSVRIVGALDGDQRNVVRKEKARYPAVFLPFVRQMEKELLGAASADIASFAMKIGRSADYVKDAFAAHAGEDDHDRFRAITSALGVGEATLASVAMSAWQSSDPNNAASVEAFALDLIKLLK